MRRAPCARCGRTFKGRLKARGLCGGCYKACHANGSLADYERRTWTNAELVAEVRFLSDDRSPASICEALNKDPGGIATALARAGRADLARPYWRLSDRASRAAVLVERDLAAERRARIAEVGGIVAATARLILGDLTPDDTATIHARREQLLAEVWEKRAA